MLCYNFLWVSEGCFCRELSSGWTNRKCSSPQGQSLWAFQPGYGLCAQIGRSFLPLPSCLPLGLQERCGDHSRHGHFPCASLTCCGISKSWATQKTHSWRGCFSAWSGDDPLRDNLGLLGKRCDLVPSVVRQVLRWQHPWRDVTLHPRGDGHTARPRSCSQLGTPASHSQASPSDAAMKKDPDLPARQQLEQGSGLGSRHRGT